MDLEYSVVRSANRKRLRITVERDRSVVVHAPQAATEAAICEAVESHRRWIQDKMGHGQKYQLRAHPPGKELVNGESVLFLGQGYRLELSDSEAAEVTLDERLRIPNGVPEERRQALREWYLQQARAKFSTRVAEHARRMGAVVQTTRVIDSRLRWGSCSPNGAVSLNWRLIKAPMFVVDYVIVHELAHLLEPNHTARFWGIVRAQAPNMMSAKEWLKENGQLLEDEV